MTPSMELVYFSVRSRGETARLMFHYTGTPFKDTQIDYYKEWPSIKQDTSRFPNNQLPVLYIDGVLLPESHVINRYLARQLGLDGGPDPVQIALLDYAYEACRQYVDSVQPYYYVGTGTRQGDLAELLKTNFIPNCQSQLPRIISLIKSNGFFSEKGVSYVDFYISNYIHTYLKIAEEEVKKYPEMVAHRDRVFALPQIQEYLKQRNDTIC
ncbi:unnamed protein product [Bursaphelenchus okinawaensis]|uniref:glutathione transferase n=1 Tax=Bursaphelenchus okinawaensis TaxID=465554 RepID=A0A811KE24_9BILA|nr:unnamed protein product [Bursaphelenchus okinawaensis]CAG9101470.1 unnamed protein product [Bursaphelenchus okinawaensis]